MIIHFKPTDLDTFRGRFGTAVVEVKKSSKGWLPYVDGKLANCSPFPNARKCMEKVEETATKLVKKRMEILK